MKNTKKTFFALAIAGCLFCGGLTAVSHAQEDTIDPPAAASEEETTTPDQEESSRPDCAPDSDRDVPVKN